MLMLMSFGKSEDDSEDDDFVFDGDFLEDDVIDCSVVLGVIVIIDGDFVFDGDFLEDDVIDCSVVLGVIVIIDSLYDGEFWVGGIFFNGGNFFDDFFIGLCSVNSDKGSVDAIVFWSFLGHIKPSGYFSRSKYFLL